MNTMQDTILACTHQLKKVEGFLRFKYDAYETTHAFPAEQLLMIAELLKEAHKALVQDIRHSLERLGQDFSKQVKSSSSQAKVFLQPAEKAEALARTVSGFPQDTLLNTIGQEIAEIHKRLRLYNLHKVSEIEKLKNNPAADTFLLAQMEEL